MYGSYDKRRLCDQVESLERDVDYYRGQMEDRERELRQEREDQLERDAQRRYERQREWQEEQSYADDWPEAIRKGLPRLKQEAKEERRMNREEVEAGYSLGIHDHWFHKQVEIVRALATIYEDEMARYEKVAAELERKKTLLRQRALERCARRLEEQFGDDTQGTAQALRDDFPGFLVEW